MLHPLFQAMLIPNSLFMIDVNAVILSNLPLFVKGKVSSTANSVMESASSGTRHVLEYARAANLTRVILTGSFANVLHPDESWVPIVATEDGKVIERLRISRTNLLVLDWNPQTPDEVKKLGLHPWCMHTAARVTAERELWKFSDANPNIDVTSSTFPFLRPSFPLPLLTPCPCAQSFLASNLGHMVADRRQICTVQAPSPGSLRFYMGGQAGQ